MKEKKKFILVISIIIIVLVILIIALSILIANKKKVEQMQEEKISREEDLANLTTQYFSDKICPQGMATIYGQYDGSNDINDLYRSLYKLVNYIENSYDEISELNDSDIKEYYTNNWWNIKNTLGITSSEEFAEFVKYLKSVELENAKYDYCKIDKESYQEGNNYLTLNISFSYEGKEDILNFKTYFAYKRSTDPEIKYEPINE